MKLYYIPGACSLSAHIAANEAGIAIEPVAVSFNPDGTRTAEGRDFAEINSKWKVPALQVEDGYLTEAQVILQYLASLAPDQLPVPAEGIARFRFLEVLNFIASDLHKGFSPLFSPTLTPEHKEETIAAIGKGFSQLEAILGSRDFVFGDRFTIADAYAFTVASWARFHKIDLAPWPVLGAYLGRIAARPAVQQALREEGLV